MFDETVTLIFCINTHNDVPLCVMSIITEIVDWVTLDKPRFWQEAVGRIIQKNTLSEEDVLDLTNLCLSEGGLKEYSGSLIDFERMRSSLEESEPTDSIAITKISDTENICALKNESEIVISNTGLTVIYGDNGSGKSSYVSVLKQVCNTRGDIPIIHKNLYLDATEPQNQKAIISYKAGVNSGCVQWENGEKSSDVLKAVHVFDTKSANSYIGKQDEVAFIPSAFHYCHTKI